MPDWLLDHLAEHAPRLVAMHADVTAAAELVAKSRVSYAEALLAWISEPSAQLAMAAATALDSPTSCE